MLSLFISQFRLKDIILVLFVPIPGHCFFYRKVPKFSDTWKICCNLPKIQTKRPNRRVFHQKEANGLANSEDPNQTAALGALHCLPRPICPKT